MAWYRRIWNMMRGERLSGDVARELSFHLAELADELESRGMSREAAEREAERRFGNPVLQKERTRDVDVVVWLESLGRDVRLAARGLLRSPGFAAVAVLSLALGIGANTAIFSLTNALLLKSLPVQHPERIVKLTMGEDDDYFTNPQWEEIRDRQTVFSGVLAHGTRHLNLNAGGLARRAQTSVVSGSFFGTLGVQPAAGRLFQPSDDVRGCGGSAVVSAGFAEREYGSVAAAVGKVLSPEGHPFPIIGVTDPAFAGIEVGSSTDLYLPLCTLAITENDPAALDARSRWYLQVLGRLKPGVSAGQAGAAMRAASPAVFEATVPTDWPADDQASYRARTLDVQSAATGLSPLRESYGRALLVLMAIVGVVLLIACANIANLLLARAAARQQDSAIRRAIGAGRGRLVRQLLTESLMLSLVGAAAGVLFAVWASRLLVRFLASGERDVWLNLSLDGRVLGFTIAVAVLTGVLFGIVPALRSSRADPQDTLRGGGRGFVGGRPHRMGRALVVAQVALSMALIAAAGLLLGTFRTLSTLDPGFDREGVLIVDADFAGADMTPERREAARAEVLRRLRGAPGVASASVAKLTPVSGTSWNEEVDAPGFEAQDRMDALAFMNQVAPGYFATMGTALLQGRDFASGDGAGSARVAIVNEAFARKFFGSAPALGRTFRTGRGERASEPITVVGVVQSAKYRSLTEDAPPTAYIPFGQGESWGTAYSFVVRGTGRPSALAAGATGAVTGVDPSASVDLTTMGDRLSASLVRSRLLASLSGFFGLLALLLSVIGLYGTMSYSVTRRRGEIGVRMAMGAAARQVVRMVFGEASRLVAAGIVLGLAIALATTRFLGTFLYGLDATDPTVMALAALTLAAVAAGAAMLPALRAARLPPMAALRQE